MKDESPKAKPRAKTTLRIAKTQTEEEDDLNILLLSLSYLCGKKDLIGLLLKRISQN